MMPLTTSYAELDEGIDILDTRARRGVRRGARPDGGARELAPDLSSCLTTAIARLAARDAGADNAIRWRDGRAAASPVRATLRRARSRGDADHLAVVTRRGRRSPSASSTTAPTSSHATCSRAAWRPAIASALLFDKTVETYVALLAVLKVNAAYVPLDASFPADRIAFILEDAGVKAIVSLSAFARQARRRSRCRRSCSTPRRRRSTAQPTRAAGRRRERRRRPTSSATSSIPPARPAIPRASPSSTPSICNFVRVAGEVYGIEPQRSRLPGHDHRLRLLGRGDLGAAHGRRHARARQARREPRRRRPRRVPLDARRSRSLLRADAARHHREGPARACASCSSPARPVRRTS